MNRLRHLDAFARKALGREGVEPSTKRLRVSIVCPVSLYFSAIRAYSV